MFVKNLGQCLANRKSQRSRSYVMRLVATGHLKMPRAYCRFSWLTEPNSESLQPWEVTKMNSSLREQLPLQKMLVPTRSIPVRG